MPFLYLPDAVSLALLIIELNLLRQTAIAHCRQELHRLRLDMLVYWTDRDLPASHQAYATLRSRLSVASELSACVSPARLFLVHRRCRKIHTGTYQPLLRELEPALKTLDDPKVRQKLRRVQLESEISLGMFLLLGSISGWILASIILLSLIRRLLSRRRANPIEWAFDLMERLFSRLGRRSLRLAYISHAA